MMRPFELRSSAPLLALALCLACSPTAAPEPSYELTVVRSKRLGAALMRFDDATGRVWLQPMKRRATPWKPVGDHSMAPPPTPGRFELLTVPKGEDLQLLRVDSKLGEIESHSTTGEDAWERVNQTDGSATPVDPDAAPGRYEVLVARTSVGARLVRLDRVTGQTWNMPLNGIGGWLAVPESEDAMARSDLRPPPPVQPPPARRRAGADEPQETDPEPGSDEGETPAP